MLKQKAVDFFKTHGAVAKAAGISRAAVSKWPDIIPEVSAYKLQAATGGRLKVNRRLYERLRKDALARLSAACSAARHQRELRPISHARPR